MNALSRDPVAEQGPFELEVAADDQSTPSPGSMMNPFLMMGAVAMANMQITAALTEGWVLASMGVDKRYSDAPVSVMSHIASLYGVDIN